MKIIANKTLKAGASRNATATFGIKGGDALGAGLYANGTTSVTSSTFSGNNATGGAGGNNPGGTARGGGVYVATTLNLSNNTIANNVVAAGTPLGPTPRPTPEPRPTPIPPAGILGNISTRLQVGTGNNVLFAGFIVQGNAAKKVLIRSAGASLTQFGLLGALGNPQLELHDSSGIIATNDNWQSTQLGGVITSDQVAEIQGGRGTGRPRGTGDNRHALGRELHRDCAGSR
ncbi:MAG: hypothetical protein M3Z64_12645 [Verrucomicrobiota bacterium]|nr:hypothetical protein [Verrucomicrobiota bacterium]